MTQKNLKDPCRIWRLEEDHKKISHFSQYLYRSKPRTCYYEDCRFPTSYKCLDTFDSYLEKFNKILKEDMPESMAMSFLKLVTHRNKQLLSAWASCEPVTLNMNLNTTPTYDGYFEYLMGYAKKLEDAITNNATSLKANVAKSGYTKSYSPSNEYYDNTNLSNYMANQGADVDMIQDVLQCGKAIKQEKPLPPSRTCRSPRQPLQKEQQIKDPAQSAIDGDLKKFGSLRIMIIEK